MLSAYLDGELDFEAHSAVEMALASDPEWAKKLRHLSEVRELLAGLGRPKPDDLSAGVMVRIRDQEGSHLPGRTRPLVGLSGPAGRFRVWAGVGILAACFLIGLVPFLSQTPPQRLTSDAPRPPAPIDPAKTDGRLADTHETTEGLGSQSTTPLKVEAPAVANHSAVDKTSNADDATAARVIADGSNPTDPRGRPDPQDRVLKLLDNPNLRKVFFVTDQVNGDASRQVSNLIGETARSDYFTITVMQGIVIDPNHPSHAKVYAFTMDESELDRFRSRLKTTFGDMNVEVDPKPEMITQLSQIGQVRTHSPAAIGEIFIPRTDVALKTKPHATAASGEAVQIVEGTFPGPPDFGASERPRHRPAMQDSPGHNPANPGGKGQRDLVQQDTASLINSSPDPSSPLRKPNELDGMRDQHRNRMDPSSREIVVLVWISSPPPG